MSLLPAPYDTNCSYYKGFSTKANCLNLCFVEEYYWSVFAKVSTPFDGKFQSSSHSFS